MKNTIVAGLAAAVLMLCGVAAGLAQDRNGTVTRYHNKAVLTVDPSVTVRDEDSRWTLSAAQLGKLACLQGGTVVMGTNTLSTITITPGFSSVPVVVTSSGPSSNRLDFVSSVTTSNAVIGAAATYATIYWMAFGSP